MPFRFEAHVARSYYIPIWTKFRLRRLLLLLLFAHCIQCTSFAALFSHYPRKSLNKTNGRMLALDDEEEEEEVANVKRKKQ